MAYTQVTPQVIVDAGLTPTYSAPAVGAGVGDSLPGDGRTFLHVKNAGGTAVSVTVHINKTADGHPITSQQVSVPATNGEKMIGPFPPLYNDPGVADHGRVLVEYGAAVTRAVLSLPDVS